MRKHAGGSAIWGKYKDEEAFPQPFISMLFLLVLPKVKACPFPCLLPSLPPPPVISLINPFGFGDGHG